VCMPPLYIFRGGFHVRLESHSYIYVLGVWLKVLKFNRYGRIFVLFNN